MKAITDLNLGKLDSSDYLKSQNKEFFNKIFLVDDTLNTILAQDKYFLIGEKGAGKTAYAVYLTNNDYQNTLSLLKSIDESDYTHFVNMKKFNHLILSDFRLVWKVILYFFIAQGLKKCVDNKFKAFFMNFSKLDNAISQYQKKAFDPEITQGVEFVEQAEHNVTFLSKIFNISGKYQDHKKSSKETFQFALKSLEEIFEDAINQVKLKKSFILFIDGVDIDPSKLDISQKEFFDLINDLTHAIWAINNYFLANIKGLEGKRIKIVMLIRPDIFDKLQMRNLNCIIRDNSILLDWRVEYKDYTKSNLFKLTDRLLGIQNDKHYSSTGSAWGHYFPYKIYNNRAKKDIDSPFIGFLRYSWYRPRDIINILQSMQAKVKLRNKDKKLFDDNDFKSCRSNHAKYMLGEVKDHMRFYHNQDQYDVFLVFFNYLHGTSRFSYYQFREAFQEYLKDIKSRYDKEKLAKFLINEDEFLQFLYELNIVGYIEKTPYGRSHAHWSFRERSYDTLKPKIKIHNALEYTIHQGISRALNIGCRFVRQ